MADFEKVSFNLFGSLSQNQKRDRNLRLLFLSFGVYKIIEICPLCTLCNYVTI